MNPKLCKCGHEKQEHYDESDMTLMTGWCKVEQENCKCKTFTPVEDDVNTTKEEYKETILQKHQEESLEEHDKNCGCDSHSRENKTLQETHLGNETPNGLLANNRGSVSLKVKTPDTKNQEESLSLKIGYNQENGDSIVYVDDLKSSIKKLKEDLFEMFGHQTGGTMGEIDSKFNKHFGSKLTGDDLE